MKFTSKDLTEAIGHAVVLGILSEKLAFPQELSDVQRFRRLQEEAVKSFYEKMTKWDEVFGTEEEKTE